jgi:RNA polymerase sigma factor (sigma-70 family)
MSEAVYNIQLMPLENQDKLIKETFEKKGKSLLEFIRKKVNDDEVAQDIFQDVFYELTESFRLAKNIDKASSWIFSVARNKIVDLFRKKKTESLDGKWDADDEENERSFFDIIKDDGILPPDFLDNKILMEEITEALGELPAEQREIFMMNEIEGRSFKEISEETKIPLNTLLSRKRYAIIFLRQRLNDLYNEIINS